ncbi:Zinc finger CCCH domain-containing protein 2 [Linum perenne]
MPIRGPLCPYGIDFLLHRSNQVNEREIGGLEGIPLHHLDHISLLHSSERYRTEACKDGKGCKRKVCFFAHSPRQLRLLPPEKTTTRNSGKVSHHPDHCCDGGSGSSAASASAASSPTSTLIGLSHLSLLLSPSFSSSPPLSPVSSRHSIHRPSKFQS